MTHELTRKYSYKPLLIKVAKAAMHVHYGEARSWWPKDQPVQHQPRPFTTDTNSPRTPSLRPRPSLPVRRPSLHSSQAPSLPRLARPVSRSRSSQFKNAPRTRSLQARGSSRA